MKQSQSEARKVKSLDFSNISDPSINSFLHVSAQTPGNTHYEKPTVTYVLWVVYLSWGVRREYQDLFYNHKENRLLSPPPTSDVPSPFPMHRKGNIREWPLVDAGTSKDLRRSLRKTRVVIGDSDDESQRQSEGAKIEVLIMPKLEFVLRKKAKALVGKGDTLRSISPEIYYDLGPA